jgi:TP901 family phage tail tape measure protein
MEAPISLNNLGLGFVFTARDLASGTINRVGGAFGQLDQRALRAQASYASNFATMGAGLGIMAAGAGTLAGAFSLASSAGRFEQELARVGAVAQASAEDLALLRNAAIRAGVETQFAPTEAVEGLGVLAQQGFNTQQSIQLLIPTLDLAAGGMISVEQAAESVTAATHVFGLSMDQAAGVANQLLAISNTTALSAGDMSLALGTVARGARLTHQSIEEMLPSIGILRNTGLDVSTSAQSVSSALTFMASRADAIRQTLGVNLTETLEDGTIAFRPFMDIALEAGEALETRFADPAERTATAVELFSRFGVGAVTGVFESLRNGVTDSEGNLRRGTEAIEYLRSTLTDSAGAAEAFRERMLDTFQGQQTLLQGSMSTLGVVVGEGFTRGLRPFIEGTIAFVNGLIDIFNSIPVEVRAAMSSMTIALGGLTFVLGTVIALGAAIALISPFIGAIASAVAGLIISMAPFALLAGSIFAVGYAVKRLMATNLQFGETMRRGFESISLAVRGLIQLFTTGELSGELAEELSRAENAGILRFVINIFAIGHRLMQFFRGIGVGFNAALTTLGPSIERMFAAFTRLGRALGFVGDEGQEAIASMPSSDFMNAGARVGAAFAGAIEFLVKVITIATTALAAFTEGWREYFSRVTPGFERLDPSLSRVTRSFGTLFRDIARVLGITVGSEDAFGSFSSTLGGIVAMALDGFAFGLSIIADLISAVIDLVHWLVDAFMSIPRVVDFIVIAVSAMFQSLADWFTIFVDTMAARLGELVSLIPEEFRSESLQGLVTSGQQAQFRSNNALVNMSARGTMVQGLASNLFPAGAQAEGGAQNTARTEAAMSAVQTALMSQQRERESQPWNVSLNVDGEAIARATGRGSRRDVAASFGTPWSEE